MRATHRESSIAGQELMPGQLITSQLTLARDWDWSRKKVIAFLEWLKAEEMVTQVSNNKFTILTITNWAFYQKKGTTKDTTEDTTEGTTKDTTETQEPQGLFPDKGTTEDTTKGTTKGTTKDTHSINKEEKKKKEYAEFVHLTEEEYQRLVKEFGEEFTAKCIEKLDGYKGANGKSYKDDNRAIRNWVVDEIKQNCSPSKPLPFQNSEVDKYLRIARKASERRERNGTL